MAAEWSAPFFRANKSDGADNSLRRLTSEQYIDVTIFRSRERLRMDEQKKLIMTPIGGGGLKKK